MEVCVTTAGTTLRAGTVNAVSCTTSGTGVLGLPFRSTWSAAATGERKGQTVRSREPRNTRALLCSHPGVFGKMGGREP